MFVERARSPGHLQKHVFVMNFGLSGSVGHLPKSVFISQSLGPVGVTLSFLD